MLKNSRPPKASKQGYALDLIRALGSLPLAIALIVALAATLIVSTSLESAYGTPFVQRHIYGAGWFDALLFLLGINIICATVLRWPFRKKHTGFITTHIGLILLLVGSFLSRWYGAEGQILLYEQESGDEISASAFELLAHTHDGISAAIELAERPLSRKRPLATLPDGSKVTLERVWTNAHVASEIEEGPAGAPSNYGVLLTLKSGRVAANEVLHLVERGEDGSPATTAQLGPAAIRLRARPSTEVETPTLRLLAKNGEEIFSLDLTKLPEGGTAAAERAGLTLKNLKYYPDAQVGADHKLVNASEHPHNPTVEFDAEDSKGGAWHVIRFARFPDFDSMHQKEPLPDGLRAELAAPADEDHAPVGPSLTLYHGEGDWTYESKSKTGVKSGKLEEGKTYETGWMDFSFDVDELFGRATSVRRVTRPLGSQKGVLAAEVAVARSGGGEERRWVTEGRSETFGEDASKLIVILRQKTKKIPFQIKLLDFRKVDYPGTQRAESYESDVRLHDPAARFSIEKTIRMNEPLDYKGYRVFQTSYIQQESGEASVFTVAKNPGISLIYAGSIVMFLGIFLTFFVPSLSSMKH